MVRRGSVERQAPHVVLLRVANEHRWRDAHFGELPAAPRLRFPFVRRMKLLEDLVESALHHAFWKVHVLGERHEDAPPVGVLEALIHDEFW